MSAPAAQRQGHADFADGMRALLKRVGYGAILFLVLIAIMGLPGVHWLPFLVVAFMGLVLEVGLELLPKRGYHWATVSFGLTIGACFWGLGAELAYWAIVLWRFNGHG